jgi:hypothetical protein
MDPEHGIDSAAYEHLRQGSNAGGGGRHEAALRDISGVFAACLARAQAAACELALERTTGVERKAVRLSLYRAVRELGTRGAQMQRATRDKFLAGARHPSPRRLLQDLVRSPDLAFEAASWAYAASISPSLEPVLRALERAAFDPSHGADGWSALHPGRLVDSYLSLARSLGCAELLALVLRELRLELGTHLWPVYAQYFPVRAGGGSRPQAELPLRHIDIAIDRLAGHTVAAIGDAPPRLHERTARALTLLQGNAAYRADRSTLDLGELVRAALPLVAAAEPGHAEGLPYFDEAAIRLTDLVFRRAVAHDAVARELQCDFLKLSLPYIRVASPLRKTLFAAPGHGRLLALLLASGPSAGASFRQDKLAALRAVIVDALAIYDADERSIARLCSNHLRSFGLGGSAFAPPEHGPDAESAARLQHKVRDQRLPRPLADLLLREWSQYLACTVAIGGADSTEAVRVLEVADRLIRAFTGWEHEVLTPARREAAMHELALVAPDLRAGLEAQGCDERRVMSLWKELTEIVLGGVRADHGAQATAGETPAKTAVQPGGAPGARLRVGDLVEYLGAEGAAMRLKLCWRSTTSGWHVFVNQAGVKSLELPGTLVAQLMHEGTLRCL